MLRSLRCTTPRTARTGATTATGSAKGPSGEWHGVTTDGDGRVTGLSLGFNQLSGAISTELGSLSNLETLWLHYNRLNGSIPGELGSLANLESLSLGGNQLSGAIPAELGNLSSLQSMDLGGNQLSGSIPAELGNLSNLEGLRLYSNQLSGPISVELGNLANLQVLHLGGNSALSGAMPGSLTGLSSLITLRLDGTGLCAPTDDAFQTWLQSVDNKSDVVTCDRVALVALYNSTGGPNWANGTNWLSDRPIGEWHGVTTDGSGHVTGLHLKDNRLSGSIPAELGSFSNLSVDNKSDVVTCDRVALVALYNSTGGPNWANGTNWLSDRPIGEWHGVTTDGSGHVTGLHLKDNRLSGSIPAELGSFSNLQDLYLGVNQLSGSIPPVTLLSSRPSS